MTEFAQCFGLDLTDPLSCDIELTSDLFQCSGASVIQTETELEYLLLTLCQCIKHLIELLSEERKCCCICRYRHIVILDKVAKMGIFFFTDRCFQRNRFLRYL